MKKAAFLLVLLFSVAVSAQKATHDLDFFRQVKIYNGLKVTLIKGNEARAVVTGESRDEVRFDIDHGILKIKLSLNNIFKDDNDTRVVVYYEELEKVDALQNSSVQIQAKIRQDNFGMEVQEGADITAEINVNSFRAKCLTGGQIEVSGKADRQDVTIKAGGQYYAKNLKSDNIDISVSAGGVADVFAKKEVNAKVRAGGTVNVYGDPEVIDKNTWLGGEVVRKN